jgi:hypothetical protein
MAEPNTGLQCYNVRHRTNGLDSAAWREWCMSLNRSLDPISSERISRPRNFEYEGSQYFRQNSDTNGDYRVGPGFIEASATTILTCG